MSQTDASTKQEFHGAQWEVAVQGSDDKAVELDGYECGSYKEDGRSQNGRMVIEAGKIEISQLEIKKRPDTQGRYGSVYFRRLLLGPYRADLHPLCAPVWT